MPNDNAPSLLKRVMAKRCDLCLPCRYARANPESLVGRAIGWHGQWCPFWKAWQDVYGAQTATDGSADGQEG